MNQKKRENNILLYFQVLAFGLILVFSPCSVRNSIQDSLSLDQTGVTNKNKTTNNFENLCSTLILDTTGDHPNEIVNSTPGFPLFGTAQIHKTRIDWEIEKDLSLRQYQSPSTVKDKTPLYLLHQQFKVYLLSV